MTGGEHRRCRFHGSSPRDGMGWDARARPATHKGCAQGRQTAAMPRPEGQGCPGRSRPAGEDALPSPPKLACGSCLLLAETVHSWPGLAPSLSLPFLPWASSSRLPSQARQPASQPASKAHKPPNERAHAPGGSEHAPAPVQYLRRRSSRLTQLLPRNPGEA